MSKRKILLVALAFSGDEFGGGATISAAKGFTGPLFAGAGPIDICCGHCYNILVEGSYMNSLSNMVLECPRCRRKNAISSIQDLERFVAELKAHPTGIALLPDLGSILKNAQRERKDAIAITEEIATKLPDLVWLRELLIPKTASDLYAFVACIIALAAWLKPKNIARQDPKMIVNNYFQSTNLRKKVSPKDKCPCDSGKSFAKCHGGSASA